MNDNKRPLSGFLSDLAAAVNDLYRENSAALANLTRETANAPDITPPASGVPANRPVPRPDLSAIPELGAFPELNDMMAASRTAAQKPAMSAPRAAAPAPKPEKPALPPFEELWKTADEAIDWTEALASSTPTDGLTPQDKWTLYHEQAASVLHGDVSAYLKVLKAANPMGDLVPYVTALNVSTASSDQLRATFSVRPDLMEKEPERYISGMAVRIARDLFALLPVTNVAVTARKDESTLLTVDFSRQEVSKVRFAFIDPVSFVKQCGGEFTPEQADA